MIDGGNASDIWDSNFGTWNAQHSSKANLIDDQYLAWLFKHTFFNQSIVELWFTMVLGIEPETFGTLAAKAWIGNFLSCVTIKNWKLGLVVKFHVSFL